MFTRTIVTSLALTGLAMSTTSDAAPNRLNWTACAFEEVLRDYTNVTFPFECSNLTVPLDYLDEKGNKTVNLQLSKIPAVNGESRGTIFFNFGGPGLEARTGLIAQGEQMLAMTNGSFDLVAFDPRGTANTITFDCYNDTEREVTNLKHGLTKVVGVEDEADLAFKWASVQNYNSDCATSKESAPEYGEVIGTGYVARDLIKMLDAIEGEDALLNFYGLSYGTVMGTTFAALFPDRVGHMVLDGNVNIPEWYDGFELAWFKDADNALLDLFERCLDAGAELCPLAARNETAKTLNKRFYQAVDDLRTAPIPLGSTFVLDPSALKTGLRIALYGPTNYLPLAVTFGELFKSEEQRNLTLLAEAWIPLAMAADLGGSLPDDSAAGVMCGDKNIRGLNFSNVYPSLAQKFANISRSLGDMGNTMAYPCLTWPWHAKGAYEGGWHDEIEPETGILFVGNTYDPVSPLSNAYNSSAIFKGSTVLEHGGVGHGTLGHPSLCTAKAVRSYFLDGELPEKGTKCEPGYGVFEMEKTWKDVLLPEMSWE